MKQPSYWNKLSFSKIIFNALLSWSEMKKSIDAKNSETKEVLKGKQASKHTFHPRISTKPWRPWVFALKAAGDAGKWSMWLILGGASNRDSCIKLRHLPAKVFNFDSQKGRARKAYFKISLGVYNYKKTFTFIWIHDPYVVPKFQKGNTVIWIC